MQQVSEYFKGLSADAKARYSMKVASSALSTDPYALPNSSWKHDFDNPPPCVKWNDMFLYLIMTPSQYTKEEIRVRSVGWCEFIAVGVERVDRSSSFVKSGWAHELRAHQFKLGESKTVLVMGKVDKYYTSNQPVFSMRYL